MTKAEACLWKYALKSSMRMGFAFRRQRPIDKYIVDFVSLELKLIIEVDGNSHNIESINLQDKDRQRDLENLGYIVIRFTDEEVLKNMDAVIFKIDSVIEETLSSAGGGGRISHCERSVAIYFETATSTMIGASTGSATESFPPQLEQPHRGRISVEIRIRCYCCSVGVGQSHRYAAIYISMITETTDVKPLCGYATCPVFLYKKL